MNIPVELVSKIFEKLELKDFLVASRACKKFNDVINAKIFLNQIVVSLKHPDDFKVTVRKYSSMKIEKVNEMEVLIIINFLENHKSFAENVTNLRIFDCTVKDSSLISQLLQYFVNLEELHLESVQVTSEASPMQLESKLNKLKILSFLYSENILLTNFIGLMSKLKVFKLCLLPHSNDQTRTIVYEIIQTILQNNCNTLRKLNLYEVNFDDGFLRQISDIDFKVLNKFSMSFNSYLSGSYGFQRFIKSQSKNLEKFKINTFDHVNDEKLQILIEHLPRLKNLNIIVCSHCDYSQLKNFHNLVNLEKLKIQPKQFCSMVEDSESFNVLIEKVILEYVNDSMKSLTIMCLKISSEIIRKLINNFPNLEFVNLSYATSMRTEHIYLMKDRLKSLKKIVIDDCMFIDNKDTLLIG
ncbi:unnamed protein product [Diamesa serratosioi]